MWQLLLAQLVISIIVAVALRPKPPKQPTVDAERPTAEAGHPVPVVFGTLDVVPTVTWAGDEGSYKESMGGGKK